MSRPAKIDTLRAGERRWDALARVPTSTYTWVVLGALLVATGAFLLYETRGTTFYRDEWTWALHRRGNSLGTFLNPHYGHFSLVPIALYRVLFATVGLDHYWPYRVLVTAAHLTCVVLVFVYAARRVGPFLGLLAAALLLFLGPASQNILWPFQMGWLLSLAAGVGALLAFDRDDRAGDLAACALLAVSLASSGLGQPIALGLLVEVLWRRRRRAWIAAVPVALYALWWVVYQTNQTGHWRQDIPLTPGFVINAAASSLSALAGLSGPATIDGPQTPLNWGIPLLIVVMALLVWRLTVRGSIPPRVVTLVTMALSFWVLTALGRAFFGGPFAGRYLYVGALFTILVGVEVAQGVRLAPRAGLVVPAAVGAAAISNIGAFRDAAAGLRSQAAVTRAELGTLDITRAIVKPDYVSEGFLFDEVVAGPYFAAEKDLGTPAASPAEIATFPEGVRKAADSQLTHIHGVALEGGTAGARPGAAPTLDAVVNGTRTDAGGCVGFQSAGFVASGATSELRVTVPARGLLVTAQGGPVEAGIRRFGDEFQSIGTLAPGASAVLRIRPDLAPQPWHLRVSPGQRVRVCGLG
jgi:hypothetical protein